MSFFDGESLAGTGTFLKIFIEFLNVGLVFLGDSNLSTLCSFNLPEINDIISFFLSNSLGVKINLDISDKWNFEVFFSILNRVSLGGTGSFLEFGELFDVLDDIFVKTGLSADRSGHFVKGNLVGSNFFISSKDVIVESKSNISDNWD